MNTFDRLVMFSMAVSDMVKAKDFYANKMGFKITTDYRQDENWWVSLELPRGGTSFTLTTAHENIKPGTMKLYLSTPDIQDAYNKLGAKGARVSAISDDLYGPGSGVNWFSLNDPDGNHWIILQPRS